MRLGWSDRAASSLKQKPRERYRPAGHPAEDPQNTFAVTPVDISFAGGYCMCVYAMATAADVNG